MSTRHEFFELLDTIKPRWHHQYRTTRDAAIAAGLLAEYNDYLQTPDGIRYLQSMHGVPDYVEQNAQAKADIEANIALARSAGWYAYRGDNLE